MGKKKKADFAIVPVPNSRPMLAAGMSDKERESLRDSLHAAINKDFGDRSIQVLTGMPGADDSPFLISSGSLAIDMAMGPVRRDPSGRWRHGMAPYKMMELFGNESTGKTTLALQMVAQLQSQWKRLKLAAAYVDLEHAIDENYARRLGVNVDRLDHSTVQSGEAALDIIDRLLKSQLYGIIVLDSVAALMSKNELDGGPTDAHVAEVGRMMSGALKHFNGALSKSPTLVIFVNQKRSTIGYGDTTTGGRALRYYSSLRLSLTRPFKNGFIQASSSDETIVGQRISAQCIKNKMYPPFKTGDAPLYYGVGVDRVIELAELAKAEGIITQAGAWYSHPCGLKAQGIGNAADQMRQHQRDWCAPIKDSLLTSFMARRGQNPDGTFIPGHSISTLQTYTPPADFDSEPTLEEIEGGPVEK